MTAKDLMDALELSRHPESGRRREIWRALAAVGERTASIMIQLCPEGRAA